MRGRQCVDQVGGRGPGVYLVCLCLVILEAMGFVADEQITGTLHSELVSMDPESLI